MPGPTTVGKKLVTARQSADAQTRPRTTVSARELAHLAFKAGFGRRRVPGRDQNLGHYIMPGRPDDRTEFDVPQLVTAVSIALAENPGRRIDATNENTNGSTDRGLWQINSVHNFDASELLSDPQYNANAAFAVWKERQDRTGDGFKAWTTFPVKAGLKRPLAARAVKAAGYTGRAIRNQDVGGTWASDIDATVRDAFDFDKLAGALWPVLMRTALVATGLGLMAWGITLLLSSAAGQVVQRVAPVAAGVAAKGAG